MWSRPAARDDAVVLGAAAERDIPTGRPRSGTPPRRHRRTRSISRAPRPVDGPGGRRGPLHPAGPEPAPAGPAADRPGGAAADRRRPASGWRTRGPEPSTTSAQPATRSRSSRASPTSCRVSPVPGLRGPAAAGERAAAVLPGAGPGQHRCRRPATGPATVDELTDAAKRCAEAQPPTTVTDRQRRPATKPHGHAEHQAQQQPAATPSGTVHGPARAELLSMRAARPITVVPRKRRGIELVMLIFALASTLGAYVLVDLNVNGELSPTLSLRGRHLRAAGRAGAHCGPLAAPVRGSGDPALRDLAQRARPGDDPPHRPDQRPAAQRRPPAADLDRARRADVHPGRAPAARSPAAAAASPTPSGWPASCCCCCRWCPGSAPRSSAPGSGSRSVRTASSPPRPPRSCWRSPSPSYLVEKRDVLALAGYRDPRHRPAPGPRPRPDPGDVADQPGDPGVAARPGHLTAVLRTVRDDALRRHRAAGLGGAGHPAVRRRGRTSAT